MNTNLVTLVVLATGFAILVLSQARLANRILKTAGSLARSGSKVSQQQLKTYLRIHNTGIFFTCSGTILAGIFLFHT